MRISCIMPSYLGEYPGSAPNRQKTFIRAVGSFLAQQVGDKELIIISDGCFETITLTKKLWYKELQDGRIKLLELPRHELFTGSVRQAGIAITTGEIICNLDTDDYFLPHHLTSIACSFTSDLDWVYFNAWIRPDNIKNINAMQATDGTLEKMNNGTVAWRKSLPVSWEGCDGVGVDNKIFIKKLMEFPNHKKIHGCGYVITNVQIKNTITV